MRVGLPAGIGDFSWAWSKLVNLKDTIDGIQIADGWPYRTVPYVELCLHPSERERIEVDYGQFQYQQILLFQKVNGLQNPTLKSLHDLNGSTVLIEPNLHLELGKRLEDWMPELPTQFHYPLYVSDEARKAVDDLLWRFVDKSSRPLLGISCASYRGAEAWKTWERKEWIEFLRRVMDETPFQPVMLGGNWDDLTYTVASQLRLPDLVGKTNTEEMIALLEELEAYVGFSSGLNVVRTVLNKPAMAFWPEHQIELSTSWAPPDMIQDGRYVASRYLPVDDVWPRAKQFLETCEKEL